MSAVSWTINGAAPEELGVVLSRYNHRTQAAGVAVLERAAAFDEATEVLAHGTLVVIARDGLPVFQGRVVRRPRAADSQSEVQTIEVHDAWKQLEETIYQEEWAVGAGSVMLPQAVLGIDKLGVALSTGQQVAAAISYAISAGVDLQLGTVDEGVALWPSQVTNVSCAEVIRQSLRFHPDWVTWLDHSTSPPTIHARASSSTEARSLAVNGSDGVTGFRVDRLDDRAPESVRIIYTTATIIDGEVYRDYYQDLAPEGGATEGPGVLSAVIELAGGQMQFQKSRIQTRAMPTDMASAKVWLKLKFPQLAAIDDSHFNVTAFSKVLVAETDEEPGPVNPEATRLSVADADDLPRELVRGTIEDWMRRKVGKVSVNVTIAATGSALEDELALLNRELPTITVTATNAVTKIYKGVTQWTPPEQAPVGIAAAIYEGLSATQHEGSVTMEAADISATRYHGTRLSLSGGRPEWLAMDAPVHTVEVDVKAGQTVVGFGPAPHLTAQDLLELQRQLRSRKVVWMSAGERASSLLGSEDAPGSKGDTVTGYDIPETTALPGGDGGGSTATQGAFWRMYTEDVMGTDHYFLQGGQVTGGTGDEHVDDIDLGAVGSEPADGTKFWVVVTGNGVTDAGILLSGFNVTSAVADDGPTLPANTLPTASAATGKTFHLLLGEWHDGAFAPSGAGALNVGYCLGSYTAARF